MSGPSSPHRERRCGLSDLGLITALALRIRNGAHALDAAQQAVLAVQLRSLFDDVFPTPAVGPRLARRHQGETS